MIEKLVQEIIQLLLICLQLKVSSPAKSFTSEMFVYVLFRLDKQMVKINSLITSLTKKYDPSYEIYKKIGREED